MGHGDAELAGEGAPGLEAEEVVGRQEGFAAEDNRPEEKDSKAKQADDYNQGWELVSIKLAH